MVAIVSTLQHAIRLEIYPEPGYAAWTHPHTTLFNSVPLSPTSSVVIAGRQTGQRINQGHGTAWAVTEVDGTFWAAWKTANPASVLLNSGSLFEVPV